MSYVKTYDLRNVLLSLCNIPIVGGGGTDGFFESTLPEEFSATSGVHGDVITSKTGNTVGEFKITLFEADPAVDLLLQLINADKDTPTGSGVGAFMLEHVGTGLQLTGKCRLKGNPEGVKFDNSEPMLVFNGFIFEPRLKIAQRS